MDTFKQFIKKELTTYEIFDILLSKDILTEMKEHVVYRNEDTFQKVFSTGHFSNERGHRIWWDDFDDPRFTEFARISLSRLYYLHKKWLKDKSKYPDLTFTFREVFGFVTEKKDKAWLASLRPTVGDLYTSFSIITIFNKDASDRKHNHDVYFSPEVKVLEVHTPLLETLTIKERTIHVIEL